MVVRFSTMDAGASGEHQHAGESMAIRASCAACGVKLKAEDRHAGKTLPCPGCQQPITIPAGEGGDEFVDPFAEEAEAVLAPKVSPAPKAPAASKAPPSLAATAPARASSPKPPPPPPPARQQRSQALVPPPVAATPAATAPVAPPKVSLEPPPIAPDEDFMPEETGGNSTYDVVDDSAFPDLSEADLHGEVISPRRKKKPPVVEDALPPALVKARRQRRVAESTGAGGWRQHLHWVLILALIPLVLSMAWGDEGGTLDRIKQTFENHPEVNPEALEQAESAYELAMLFPDHRIEGAWLAADSYWHWGLALGSGLLFMGLFSWMWPEKESRAGMMLLTGIVTGTVGIMLLLAFQYIAFTSEGVQLRGGIGRGRGVAAILFLIVQFIGFSYRCALDDSNGFVASFFGFTFGVGLCEELCKALPVAFYLSGGEKRSLRQACLVGLASGVGFGISEGITYCGDSYNGIHGGGIYVIRFLSCVSLHAIWAGSVAILIYRNRDYLEYSWEAAFFFVVYYLLVAMILHGAYDTLLKQEHELLAVVTALMSFVWFQWLLSRAAAEA